MFMDRPNSRLKCIRQSSDVNQSGNVNRELYKHREKHIEVEDIPKGTLARELLDRL